LSSAVSESYIDQESVLENSEPERVPKTESDQTPSLSDSVPHSG
jgi:hypothetical protein